MNHKSRKTKGHRQLGIWKAGGRRVANPIYQKKLTPKTTTQEMLEQTETVCSVPESPRNWGH